MWIPPAARGTVLNPYLALVTLLEPSLTSVREPAERVRAMSRCLRVLNAIQARGEPGSDSAPISPISVFPRKRRSTPTTASRCISRRLPEGWLVYSVGMNLVDDGGTFEKVADVGVGPIKANEDGEEAVSQRPPLAIRTTFPRHTRTRSRRYVTTAARNRPPMANE